MSSDIRVIKKYPNRRLYDTHVSRYITLEEVRQLVINHVRFRVEDKRSKNDITRTILLQVISEREEDGNPIFSSDLLTHIIRFYGAPMQSSISRYLELSMRLFMEQQQGFSDKISGLLGQVQEPVLSLKELADRQVPIWRTVRKEFLKNLSRVKTTAPLKGKNDADKPADEGHK